VAFHSNLQAHDALQADEGRRAPCDEALVYARGEQREKSHLKLKFTRTARLSSETIAAHFSFLLITHEGVTRPVSVANVALGSMSFFLSAKPQAVQFARFVVFRKGIGAPKGTYQSCLQRGKMRARSWKRKVVLLLMAGIKNMNSPTNLRKDVSLFEVLALLTHYSACKLKDDGARMFAKRTFLSVLMFDRCRNQRIQFVTCCSPLKCKTNKKEGAFHSLQDGLNL
jgi:hypothetical protein